MDFNFWVALANRILKPQARRMIAMAEEDGAWIHLTYKIQEIIAVCVGGQVKILDLAMPRQFPGALTKKESLSRLRFLQASTGRLWISIPDEENRVLRMPDHAHGQLVRGGFFGHHPGGHDEDFSAT